MSDTFEIGLTLPAELELTQEELDLLGAQFKADVIDVLTAKEVEIPILDDICQVVSSTE